jgi:putative SOS response-associated peptidase YedK
MCFSARVQQDLQKLARRFGAEIAWEMFADLFKRRLDSTDVKASRALERNFDEPQSDLQQQIKADIDAYRKQCETKWERELFTQKKRLADAERSLATKETKKARESARIAASKIETHLRWLSELRRPAPSEADSRIFPMMIAPVVATIAGNRRIMPMRYTCRLAGKPANYDLRYPGTYNARRDNLNGFWSSVYGRQHAVMVVDEFFENVPLHLYERRELRPDEEQANVVLRFQPNTSAPMLVACLWDRWKGSPGESDLFSFAAVTDEPPPEIAATGHQRCIISLKEANVAEWLEPETLPAARLETILTDKECPYYEHRVAA